MSTKHDSPKMTGEKYNLSLFFACVAVGCLMTSVFLKLHLTSTGSERDGRVMTSDPAINGDAYKEDLFSHTNIWMSPSSDKNGPPQPLSAVKTMVALGAALSLLAIILTSLKPVVHQNTHSAILEFTANVGIMLTGIYLILCVSSYVAITLDPKSVNYVDQNAVGMFDVITLILAICAMVLYRHEITNRVTPREIIIHL